MANSSEPPETPPSKPSRPSRRRPKLPETDPGEKPFTPEILDRTVIAMPLLDDFAEEKQSEEVASKSKKPFTPKVHPVIIDLNLDYPGGRKEAKRVVQRWAQEAIGRTPGAQPRQGIDLTKSEMSNQYLFGALERRVIEELVRINAGEGMPDEGVEPRAIYHIWPDFEIRPLLTRSVATVKADAARIAYSAQGEKIVWAVLDSGIQKGHPHFETHGNLVLDPPLRHRDFTVLRSETPPEGASEEEKAAFVEKIAKESEEEALRDGFGHGTHVAGIIAGEVPEDKAKELQIQSVTRYRDEAGKVTYQKGVLKSISGIAPRCRLISFKVLDAAGKGRASNLIAAIAAIQEINGHGRRIRIHGVNMSVGYDFEPEWFACGQSPLCVEVDQLVRSGVVVVVAAGNTGYGYSQTAFRGTVAAGMDLTINDPGNAELAITVGSTHRSMPHVYGVSYFSSKGPTGDGRAKPDIVAPGEKIISCAAGQKRDELAAKQMDGDYREESGTSMAAPHVSGAIAAFLSIREEFIGRPEQVKQIFLSTATDLKRERYFQGHGLVDLMRAIQSV
ncbi:MAG TPA: S8 family peptidase [Thermoanaerobaculia bacterium]|jgi:subtilisin family serine protease